MIGAINLPHVLRSALGLVILLLWLMLLFVLFLLLLGISKDAHMHVQVELFRQLVAMYALCACSFSCLFDLRPNVVDVPFEDANAGQFLLQYFDCPTNAAIPTPNAIVSIAFRTLCHLGLHHPPNSLANG